MSKQDGRTILITGGAGFVGSSIGLQLKRTLPNTRVLALDNLKRRGSELNLSRLREAGVDFVHGDVRQRGDLRVLPKIDVLIDCSAEPAVMAGYGAGAEYMADTNLAGTINCLELAARDRSDVVFLSTSRVYPMARMDDAVVETVDRFEFRDGLVAGSGVNGINEQFPLEGPRSLYGATKLASELLLQEYGHMHGLRFVIDRCGVIAGPWQMGRTDQGFVLLWLARHLWKEPLGYIGHGGLGKQVRDVLHVDDLCELVALQLERLDEVSGRTFNVGGGSKNAISLRECTALCAEATGNHIEMDCDPSTRPGDIKAYVTDNSLVTAALGWEPQRDVRRIISDSLTWLKQHEKELRVLLGSGPVERSKHA
jgi:CDP-paratose 2-epimerase